MSRRTFAIHLDQRGDARAELLDAIVEYEAAVRGVSASQAFAELVWEAADVIAYPPELQQKLREIDRAAREEAAERALASLSAELGDLPGAPGTRAAGEVA